MKKIKIIFLIALIIIVSGCKIRSNVEVLPDGTVIEKVTITETKEGNNLTEDEYSDYIEAELKDSKRLINYGNYKSKKINNKKQFGATFTKKHKSICAYFQDTIFNQYVYRHISCKEDEVFVFIANDTPFLERKDEEDFSNPLDLRDVKLTISLPVKAQYHNADEVKGKNYIWKFDDNTTGKNFELTINKNTLKQAEIENTNLIKKKEFLNTVVIVIIFASILAIITVIGFILYKKYIQNKIEY